MINIINISQYIINHFSKLSPEVINPTTIKLQQLLYYVKVWTLIAKQPIINDDFIRGKYSPINQKVVEFFNQNKDQHPQIELSLSKNQQQLINFILENYVVLDSFTLKTMTHLAKPYKNTPLNQVISPQSIIDYYQHKRFAKNFQPFDLQNNYFYPLDNDCFILDIPDQEAEQIVRFKNYQEYQKIFQQVKQELNDLKKSWLLA